MNFFKVDSLLPKMKDMPISWGNRLMAFSWLILSAAMILVLLILTYFSFAQFTILSLQIFLSQTIRKLGSMAADHLYVLPQPFLWYLYTIPLLQVSLTTSFQMLRSFFSNLWNLLSFDGISRYFNNQLDFPRTTAISRLIAISLFFAISAGILLFAVFGNTEKFGWQLIYGLSILSILPPVADVLWTIATAWRVAYRKRSPPATPTGQYLSVVDPWGLFDESPWRDFLDSHANILRRHNRSKRCAGTIVLVVYAFLAFGIATLEVLASLTIASPVFWAIQAVVVISTFPLAISASPITLWICRKELKEHFIVKTMVIIGLVLTVVFFVILIAFAIYARVFFDPFVITDPTYVQPTGEVVTKSAPAAFCNATFGDWTLVQLIGLAMVPHSLRYPFAASTVLEYILPGPRPNWRFADGTADFPWMYLNASLGTVFVFQGFVSSKQIPFMLENGFIEFSQTVFGYLMPFIEAVRPRFIGRFLNDAVVGIAKGFGLGGVSNDVWTATMSDLAMVKPTANDVYVGYSCAGNLAKAAAIAFGARAIGVASGDYNASAMSWIKRPAGSVYRTADVGFEVVGTEDVVLPRLHSMLSAPDAYETFCLAAAGCVLDDSFDHLCNITIGFERYRDYFGKWGRKRI
jgi:hypothetical protein